jgi:hypothetical protein
MRFVGFRPGELFDAGARYRAEHSAWLTHALQGSDRYPRIPARAVRCGGYDRMMARESGRWLAARWWAIALSRFGR